MNDSKDLMKDLIGQCYRDQPTAAYVSDMDIDQLYRVDSRGWQKVTPDELKNIIANEGPQNIVLQCSTHDMAYMRSAGQDDLDRSFLDEGLQEFDAVDVFEYSNGDLIMSGVDAIVSTIDMHEAWQEFQAHELDKIQILSEDQRDWLDAHSWDGDFDSHSWSDEIDFAGR